MISIGIICVLIAICSWGFGDFFIQKGTRVFGDWVSLFYICLFGFIFSTPFVISDLKALLANGASLQNILLFLGLSTLTFVVGLLDFEALKVGKISVIEPIYTLELVVTTVLSALLIQEAIKFSQYTLIFFILIGVVLVTTKSFNHFKNISLEKGVKLAILATLGMGAVNFLFGFISRETSPLLINWFVDGLITIVIFIYLYLRREHHLIKDFRHHKRLVIGMSVFDNAAWIAYSYSMLYIPIAIATGLTQSYIAIAGLLGVIINKERVKLHQVFGFAIVIISSVILGYTVG